MVRDGNYNYGEHRITYRVVKLLCCTPKTNVTVNYTSIKKLILLNMIWINKKEMEEIGAD